MGSMSGSTSSDESDAAAAAVGARGPSRSSTGKRCAAGGARGRGAAVDCDSLMFDFAVVVAVVVVPRVLCGPAVAGVGLSNGDGWTASKFVFQTITCEHGFDDGQRQ